MFKNPIPYYHSKEFHLTLRDIVDNVKTGFGGQLEVSTLFGHVVPSLRLHCTTDVMDYLSLDILKEYSSQSLSIYKVVNVCVNF